MPRLRRWLTVSPRCRAPAVRYTIVIEEGDTSFGAYVPDLPGCVAAGKTREEVVTLIRETIEEHLQVLRGTGGGEVLRRDPPAVMHRGQHC